MRGTIEAESELGKGSTFAVEIPFASANGHLQAPVPAIGLRGLRVLVVDDNATNRRIFEAYVASWGMRPGVAADAVDALAQLQRAAHEQDPYSVALLDRNMPGESGLELARRITASPALRDTRLIMLTSSAQSAADHLTNGIRCHLTKPVRQSRLLDAIREAMAIDLPGLAQAEDEAPGPRRHQPAGVGGRILVAEDQRINWMLIERMLSKRGVSAVNATDGRQVLELLERERYDLVLMDCQMPVLDGYDAAREIRRREADGQGGHVPIVAMTANAMLGDRERCLAAGMDDYMAKPIGGEVLDEVLARWLLPAPGDVQTLDQVRLDELRSIFPGQELAGLLRQTAVEIGAELDHFGTAVRQGDGAAVAEAAHRLKNSAGLIGATWLADAVEPFESRAETDGADARRAGQAAVQALLEQWKVTRAAIEVELSRAE
jgi:CheY-like chemotaxis protein